MLIIVSWKGIAFIDEVREEKTVESIRETVPHLPFQPQLEETYFAC